MKFLSRAWRSPAGQPAWARPTLATLTLLAGFFYGWDVAGNLEIYYAAAARSMSMSWHNFFFAAFDPAGSITVDKLPGAFWLQALAVRLFGVHAWALVAPQVIEGMLTVLVLFRVVRRLAGPHAGIVAAAVLVLSPATVALNRGNISDTLMVLLLVLAADATVRAMISGRLRSLVLAGVWVGLAFQAKMIEAWLVLPGLALAYLVTAPGGLGRRLGRLGVTALVTGALSLSWVAVVSLWPASGRPYVDGSQGNSVFSQVFVYNGFGRIDQPTPNQLLTKSIGIQLGSTPASWHRLLSGPYGRDTAWLIPAAVIALVACLALSRRRPTDRLLRGGALLWGTWMLVLFTVFSASSSVNAYYTAALSPAIAALLGMGAAQAWERRASPATRLILAVVVGVTCGYAAWLLPDRGVGVVSGLNVAVIVLGLAGLAVLLIRASIGRRPEALALAAIAALAVPAIASVAVVAEGFGPFDTPFELAAASLFARQLGAVAQQTRGLLPPLEQVDHDQPDLMATQTAAVAAPFIYDSGREVFPIGGFTGTGPEPPLATLKAMIAKGDFHVVVQAPQVDDPRLVWISQHCLSLGAGAGSDATSAPGGLRFDIYYCGRVNLGRTT